MRIWTGRWRLPTLLAIVVLAVGCGTAGVPTASATPSTGSQATSPSEFATPSASPSPTSDPSVAPEEDGFAAGSIATTTAEGIRLREEPSVSAAQVNRLIAGTAVVVLAGPAVDPADPSLEWWQVMPTDDFCDTCGLDLHPGWMTTGPAKEWLEAVALDCPTSSTFTAESWDDEEPSLQCFGNRSIILEGILDYWCCRGITLGQTRPAWLAMGLSPSARLRVAADDDRSWGPELHVAPGSGVTLPDRGTVVRIRGHFDDPAAETCRTTVTDDEWDRYPDLRWVTLPSLAVYGCRTKFVIESVETVDFVPLPTHHPQ